ncbi:hypothetical protein [Cellulosimicrobium marinum]|uniref:hypothetical protein n=1 Tax=Cellulosimicrobium marinum TaxID=1638992 RepID=UPI001E329CC7|nr:hypothetical protein [Cellulosimicrobium marinum]MCB7136905.1 hypothetical protein [Cellulosimicrobium marinum]
MLRTTVPRARSRGQVGTSVVPATGRFGTPVVLLVLLAATAVTQLADRGFAVVHQCVTVPGPWRLAGVHLALVHEAPDCPSGTALGGEHAAVVTVLGVLALPVLLAHVAAGLVVWGAAASVRRTQERVRALATGTTAVLRAALARVLGTPLPRTAPGTVRPAVPDAVPAALHHLADAVVRTRRGPPRLALA